MYKYLIWLFALALIPDKSFGQEKKPAEGDTLLNEGRIPGDTLEPFDLGKEKHLEFPDPNRPKEDRTPPPPPKKEAPKNRDKIRK